MGYSNTIDASWRPGYGMNVPRPTAPPRHTLTPPPVSGRDATPASDSTPAADPQENLASLLARMADGDEAALAAFYDATVAKAYGLALRIVGTPPAAEEVVVDTYHQAWREARRFDAQRGAPMAFLMMMCRSRALDALRSRDHAVLHEDPASLVDDADPTTQRRPGGSPGPTSRRAPAACSCSAADRGLPRTGRRRAARSARIGPAAG